MTRRDANRGTGSTMSTGAPAPSDRNSLSIGPDGPSQMGLEDIASFRTVWGSTVLYPSDANQAAQLVAAMVDRPGVVYMRTTRVETPVIYGPDETFRIGGSKVVRCSPADTLTLIGHRAMVFIELKTPFGDVGPLEKRVTEVLVDHNGPTAVIGFNPYSHAWFADHHPQILRGLDSYSWNDDSARKLAPEMRKSLAALEQVFNAQQRYPDSTELQAIRRLLMKRRLADASASSESQPGGKGGV